jgi:hypothetical protein
MAASCMQQYSNTAVQQYSSTAAAMYLRDGSAIVLPATDIRVAGTETRFTFLQLAQNILRVVATFSTINPHNMHK